MKIKNRPFPFTQEEMHDPRAQHGFIQNHPIVIRSPAEDKPEVLQEAKQILIHSYIRSGARANHDETDCAESDEEDDFGLAMGGM